MPSEPASNRFSHGLSIEGERFGRLDGVKGTQPHRQRWPQRASAQEELIMDSTDFNEMSWVSWMTPVDDAPNRETWLMEAVDRLARSTFPAFKQPKWRVTCG
jgi:hypothetical protein